MTGSAEGQEILPLIQTIFDDRIPFNRMLGLKVESLDLQNPRVRFEMRDELVGNYQRGTLHGGVISTVIDVTGGLVAFIGSQKHLAGEPLEKKLQLFGKLGTIDLRVDYLRPGLGKWFVATGHILRIGRKVAVSRVELHNDRGSLVAVGTGAYVIA
ncbi:MAG: thioesterase family protein [Desulfuromonadaceae bacterium]|nr:thioesterase family protein [Desulfuromonadaceae bacterium]